MYSFLQSIVSESLCYESNVTRNALNEELFTFYRSFSFILSIGDAGSVSFFSSGYVHPCCETAHVHTPLPPPTSNATSSTKLEREKYNLYSNYCAYWFDNTRK